MNENLVFLGVGILVGVLLSLPAAIQLVAWQRTPKPVAPAAGHTGWLDQPV